MEWRQTPKWEIPFLIFFEAFPKTFFRNFFKPFPKTSLIIFNPMSEDGFRCMEIDTMIHSWFIFSFIYSYSYAMIEAWYNLDCKVGENCKTSCITFYSDKSDAMKVQED